MTRQIEFAIESGSVVGWAPGTPFEARVPLRRVAEAFEARGKLSLTEQERRHFQGMHGSETEIGAKKSAPRGFKRVVKAAKKAANSKIIRKVRKVMGHALPGPFGLAIRAAPLAKRLAKRQKSKNPAKRKAAKQAALVSRKMASGTRIAPKKLAKIAKKLGVSVAEIKAGATLGALANAAHAGNPQAQQTAATIAQLDQAEQSNDAGAAVAVTEEMPPAVLEQAAEAPDQPVEAELEQDDQPADDQPADDQPADDQPADDDEG